MAYKIEGSCILCGLCGIECLNQTIRETKTIFVIDPDKCIECVGNFEFPKVANLS